MKMASHNGLHGLTIGGLAKVVGMSKSGLFAHFNSKDNLQLMVLKRATDHFTDTVLRPAFRNNPRGEPRVRALFENWLDYLNDSSSLPGGDILLSVSTELDDQPGPLRELAQTVQGQLIDNIEKSARFAIEERHFRRDLDTKLFTWKLYSYILGYHHFKRMMEDPLAEARLRKSFEDLINYAKEEIQP